MSDRDEAGMVRLLEAARDEVRRAGAAVPDGLRQRVLDDAHRVRRASMRGAAGADVQAGARGRDPARRSWRDRLSDWLDGFDAAGSGAVATMAACFVVGVMLGSTGSGLALVSTGTATTTDDAAGFLLGALDDEVLP